MVRFLPFSLLTAFASLFGLAWILIGVDPISAPWYIFVLFVLLLFGAVLNFLGLLLYYIRTRFYKRYSANWYFKTSFKMAFFVATFVVVAAILAILDQVNLFSLALTIIALGLFAFWSYLGKKN